MLLTLSVGVDLEIIILQGDNFDELGGFGTLRGTLWSWNLISMCNWFYTQGHRKLCESREGANLGPTLKPEK